MPSPSDKPHRWSMLLAMFAAGAMAAGCATMPDRPVQRALYHDVRQVVETEERLGWLTDPAEYEDAAPQILQSVCQVKEEERLDLLDWLDERIEEEGGPAEDAYEREGESLSAIDELLTLERMRGSLEYADERAADDCPFWLKPDPEFTGVQSDTHRFVILAESFGGLLMAISDRVAFGGGGALRLMPGYGFTDQLTIATGLELGAAGGVAGIGGDDQAVTARATGAIPILVRVHDDTWVYDTEVTVLSHYYKESLAFPPGVRGAFGVGITSVRISGIMPVILGFVGYEFYPEFKDLPVTHVIRVGTRVGVDFDP